jgi:hypothetical protein
MTRSDRPLPAGVLFSALLAITLNLMQPLVHAVLMRDGDPGALWSAWCQAAVADPDRPGAMDREASVPPVLDGQHDCCLGLAHAASLVVPSASFVLLSPIDSAPPVLLPSEQRPSVAIRDGPPRPRGPPSSPVT